MRRRIKAFLRSAIAGIVEDIMTTPDFNFQEEDLEVEEAIAVEYAEEYTAEEMFKLLVEEASSIREQMESWSPEESTLEAVLELLPAEDEEIEASDMADMLMEVQRRFIIDPFLSSFMKRLHSFREDAVELEEEDYFQHVLQAGVLSTQLVQVMAIATQALIAAAYIHKRKQEKETQPEPKPTPAEEETSDSWLPWGMVAGES